MSNARAIFKPAAIIMVIGGTLLIVASIYVFLAKATFAFGALQGLLIVLFTVIIGGFEAASAKPVYKTEQGSWRTAVMFTALSALLKLFTALIAFDAYSRMSIKDLLILNLAWACVILIIAEAVLILLFLVFKMLFMPTEEEVKAAMKKMEGISVKTVSECPKCHELVEKDWVQCPQCGTRLPRICANCSVELPSKSEKCSSCGAMVERPEAASKIIATLKALSEEEAKPEARSVRYARLADAYLKAGETENALETYRKAIHYTEFDRKRSNFMVKMANILESEGQVKEAIEVLDAALQLDPEDEAGARAMKAAIGVRPVAKAAMEAYKKGDRAASLRLAEESLAKDAEDLNGVGWIKAEDLVAKAQEMKSSNAKKEDVLKVLDEATRLDPYSKTQAGAMRAEIAPKEKKKMRRRH